MAFYTSNFLQKRRVWWMKNIAKVEALVGSTWYTGTIQKKALEGEKIVIHAVFTDLTASACTITSLRVIDIDGEVALRKLTALGVKIDALTPEQDRYLHG